MPRTSRNTATRAIPFQMSRGPSNCGSARSVYPGTYAATSATIFSIDSAIAAVSASDGIAQNTVSRMIIGGSTGFRMMIALPRPAPPTFSMARAVVWVNSSMLARVPGPAERDAIEATISAYGTGTTGDRVHDRDRRLPAARDHVEVGGVRQRSSRFTGGHTNGPTAAGVRSIAVIPASS